MDSGHKPDHHAVSKQLQVGEAASLLGISLRHLRKLIAEGDIPIWRAGNRVLIDPEKLRRWIDAGGTTTSAQKESGAVVRASFQGLYKCLDAAAASLGISAAKLREEIDAGRMQAIRIGQRILVPVAAIDEYLELCQKEADEETEIRLAAIESGRPKKVKA